jgi:hypothetical protein
MTPLSRTSLLLRMETPYSQYIAISLIWLIVGLGFFVGSYTIRTDPFTQAEKAKAAMAAQKAKEVREPSA